MDIIKISVRNLVEFISRTGDIDSRYISATRAREGIRIHKKIQSIRKKEAVLQGFVYESELTFKHKFEYKEYAFSLEGRADGAIAENNMIAIEEIKSTTRNVEEIEAEPNHWHWAQAKMYGYMYCLMTESPKCRIILTYCHVESEVYKSFDCIYSFEELEKNFYDTIEKYYVYAKLDGMRIDIRNKTASVLEFPFGSYRGGQREMAVSVFTAAKNGKRLFVQAPTGIGKTVSTLYPSIKALGEGLISKIFYITARTTTRQAAADCLTMLQEKGLVMRTVMLTAKDKICFLENRACNPVDCPYAKGHFDRVNKAVVDIIENETVISGEVIAEYAKKHVVCPYEYSLDISNFCDVIIGDYNYAFDPTARLKRYFGEAEKNDYMILADEAHNLIDRAREMFSAEIVKGKVLDVRRVVGKSAGGVYKALTKINNALLDMGRFMFEGENTVIMKEVSESFKRLLFDFTVEADKYLALNEGNSAHSELMDFYFNVLDFMRILEIYDERYITLITEDRKNITMRLLCLDPSYQLSLIHGNTKSAVFFSATLMPIQFYSDVIGGNEADYVLKIPSPFDEKNMCLMINNSISTKYRDRDSSYERLAAEIFYTTDAKKGNYMVFFSSYAYLEKVKDIFEERYPDRYIIAQQKNSDANTAAEFLDNFKEGNAETIIGFAVLGGIFSEGIDLAGDRLIGVIVVGVGLPLISVERDVIRNYYIEKDGPGYEYAYMYPGMNKVMQAAGRVIRKDSDRGIVYLIDSRFLDSRYREIFPDHWYGYKRIAGTDMLKETLREFWQQDI